MLKRTLGVPLFQEQAMQIAITAAKFTPDEADGLRRAMATFRHTGNVHLFRDKFIDGMTARGYDARLRRELLRPDRRLRRIRLSRKPCGELCAPGLRLGLDQMPLSRTCSAPPSSTASRWVSISRRSSCATRASTASRSAPADVNFSDWDCTLEPGADGRHAVRLGFRLIHGLKRRRTEKAHRGARQRLCLRSSGWRRSAGISRFTIERLAEADAFRSMGLDRRAALWAARRLDVIGIRTTRRGRAQDAAERPKSDDSCRSLTPHMSDELFPEPAVALPAMPLSEHVVEDYVATGLSLKEHPVRFFRERLTALGAMRNAELRSEDLRQDCVVTVAGLVLVRQRPGTAKGVIFMTLEDETDIANIIVWPKAFEKNRRDGDDGAFPRRARPPATGGTCHPCGRGKFLRSFRELPFRSGCANGGDLFSPKLSGGQHPVDTQLLLKSRDFH